MAQRREILIKRLQILQAQFPEFYDILEEVIEAIEIEDIDMGLESDNW